MMNIDRKSPQKFATYRIYNSLSISVLNNLFNLLVTFNAASNFILYCVLSEKYRKTVKHLFCGTKGMRRNTMSSSRFTSGRTTTSSFYSRSRNSTIPNIPKQRGPRFSISKDEYANLQTETAKRNRFSISTATSPSRNNSIVNTLQVFNSFVLMLKSIILLCQGDNEPTEEIQLKTNSEQQSKQDKGRIKSIRFAFTPSNLSVCWFYCLWLLLYVKVVIW